MNKIYRLMSLAAVALLCMTGCDDEIICISGCENFDSEENNTSNNDDNSTGNNDNSTGNNDNTNSDDPDQNCPDGGCISCNDHIQNGDETDVDCGGSCDKCDNDMKCSSNTDCESDYCDNGLCKKFDPCADGVISGDESDVDCGGSCQKCTDGNSCQSAQDCSSGFCDANTCTSCSDGIKNGDESDIDCGGRCGATCVQDKTCNTDNDCASYNCVEHICKAVECPDMAEIGDILINEVFANPDTSVKMEHSTNQQMKYIELYNKTDKTLQLYNLSLTYEGNEIHAKGCIPAQSYLILHPAGQTMTALDMDAKTMASDNIETAIHATSGNVTLAKRTDNTIIHKVTVPETTKGIAAGRDQSEANSQTEETLVPHTSVKTLESGVKNLYTPGLPNNAGFPMGQSFKYLRNPIATASRSVLAESQQRGKNKKTPVLHVPGSHQADDELQDAGRASSIAFAARFASSCQALIRKDTIIFIIFCRF